eukprot:9145_1
MVLVLLGSSTKKCTIWLCTVAFIISPIFILTNMYLKDVEITNSITKIETINANTNIFMNNNKNNTWVGGSNENEFNDILNKTATNSGDPNPMMKTVYAEKKPSIHSNNPITIVTSFFLIEKSKHTIKQ